MLLGATLALTLLTVVPAVFATVPNQPPLAGSGPGNDLRPTAPNTGQPENKPVLSEDQQYKLDREEKNNQTRTGLKEKMGREGQFTEDQFKQKLDSRLRSDDQEEKNLLKDKKEDKEKEKPKEKEKAKDKEKMKDKDFAKDKEKEKGKDPLKEKILQEKESGEGTDESRTLLKEKLVRESPNMTEEELKEKLGSRSEEESAKKEKEAKRGKLINLPKLDFEDLESDEASAVIALVEERMVSPLLEVLNSGRVTTRSALKKVIVQAKKILKTRGQVCDAFAEEDFTECEEVYRALSAGFRNLRSVDGLTSLVSDFMDGLDALAGTDSTDEGFDDFDLEDVEEESNLE